MQFYPDLFSPKQRGNKTVLSVDVQFSYLQREFALCMRLALYVIRHAASVMRPEHGLATWRGMMPVIPLSLGYNAQHMSSRPLLKITNDRQTLHLIRR